MSRGVKSYREESRNVRSKRSGSVRRRSWWAKSTSDAPPHFYTLLKLFLRSTLCFRLVILTLWACADPLPCSTLFFIVYELSLFLYKYIYLFIIYRALSALCFEGINVNGLIRNTSLGSWEDASNLTLINGNWINLMASSH